MFGEGSNFIRDDIDNRSASRSSAGDNEATAGSASKSTDGDGSAAAGSGGSAVDIRGDKGKAAIADEARARKAMAPKDTTALTNLEITQSKPEDKALEKPNRFKDLFDVDKASIYAVTKGPDGKEVLTPKAPLKEGEKLGAGDYLISLHRKDGKADTDRQLRVHIPKPNAAHPDESMSVVFALHGVMPRGLNPTKFTETVPLAQEADNSESPFIVVWPQAAKNSVGGSDSYFWIDDNTPLRKEHVEENAKRLGYKDRDFIAALPEWIKKNTNAAGYDTFTLAAHSQGAVLANELSCDPRLVFPNVVFIHGTMMTDKKGTLIAGTVPPTNAVNTVFFHPKDQLILPEKNAATGRAMNRLLQQGLGVISDVKKNTAKQAASDTGKDSLFSNIHSLASAASNTDPGLAMDNVNQDPLGHIDHYLGLLGNDIDRYVQLPKNKNQQLKQPKDFQEPVTTTANFVPNAHGPIDTIWSAQSRTNGRTLTIVDHQGGHMPAGKARGTYSGLDTAATIAYYHRKFNQQKGSQTSTALAKRDQDKS